MRTFRAAHGVEGINGSNAGNADTALIELIRLEGDGHGRSDKVTCDEFHCGW